MTRANPSCSNFGMANELRGVEKKNGESISTFSASVPRPAFENMNKNKWEQNQFNKNVTVIYLMLGNYEKY